MNLQGWEFVAERTLEIPGVRMFFRRNNPDGSVEFIDNVVTKRFTREEMDERIGRWDYEWQPDTLIFPAEIAQQIVDELWRCGYRPTEGTGSAGSLKATQNHLADMQKLSWALLGAVVDQGRISSE